MEIWEVWSTVSRTIWANERGRGEAVRGGTRVGGRGYVAVEGDTEAHRNTYVMSDGFMDHVRENINEQVN